MKRSELDDIRAVIKRIRDQRYPTLDLDFLNAVIDAEVGFGDDDAMTLRQIQTAADAALSKSGDL